MRFSRRSVVLHLLAALVMCVTVIGQQKPQTDDSTPPYRNPKLAIEDRVADLLSRMTLEEKIEQVAPSRGQAVHIVDPTGTFTDESASATLARWWDPDMEFPPKRAATLRNGLQRYQK